MVRTRTRFRGHQCRWHQCRWLLSILVVLVVSGVGWWLSWAQQGQGGQRNIHAAEGSMSMASMGYVFIDAHGHVRARAVDPYFGAHSEAILQRLARVGAAASPP